MKFLKKRFRQIKKFPTWIFFIPAMLLKIIKKLMRTSVDDPHNHIHSDTPFVTVTWHNRLLFFPLMFPGNVRRRTMAVVSASRDGQYVTDLIHYFGLKSLRGSSSRRGVPVFREALSAIKQGYHISFTPDGPRGPRYRMSKGPIQLASMSGMKLLPISVNATDYWEIKSWDKFQIPKPWSKVTLVLSDAITVPPDLDEEGLEKCRIEAEKALMSITADKNGQIITSD